MTGLRSIVHELIVDPKRDEKTLQITTHDLVGRTCKKNYILRPKYKTFIQLKREKVAINLLVKCYILFVTFLKLCKIHEK